MQEAVLDKAEADKGRQCPMSQTRNIGIAAHIDAGIEAQSGQTVLNAQVPLAEMFGYATAIRSLSKGRASYSMEPWTFEQVPSSIPSSILASILEKANKRPAARS